VGRENSLPYFTEVAVPAHSAIALVQKGQLAGGMDFGAELRSFKATLAVWEQSGARIAIPYVKSFLAEGMAQLGDLDGALRLIDESIAQIEQPGWEEGHSYAETLRIKGWVFSLKGDLEGAERNYVASLDWARQQQAKSWELRTSTSYARLMREQGRVREACELLAPVYGWFGRKSSVTPR
jgi:hypothetical protein